MTLLRFLFLLLLLASPAFPAQAPVWTSNDYYVAGLNYFALKDYPKALAYLNKTVQMDPRNWQAYQTLGYIFYLSGKPEEALAAFDRSLQWNKDNPKVRNLAENIRERLIWEAEAKDLYPHVFRKYEIWVALRAGAMTASLGDLPKAASAFNSYKDPTILEPHAQTDDLGFLGGMEVGFMMDKWNGWSVLFDAASFNGYRSDWLDNYGNTYHETIQPDMLSFQAEYYHYFQLGLCRLSLGAGGGIYHTIVTLNSQRNGDVDVILQDGQLTGLGWGVILGAGFEIALGEQFSLGLSVRGRYATTGRLQGTLTTITGAQEEEGLVLDSGLLEAYPTNVIDTYNLPYANVDYVGGDVGFSISYHY